MALPEYLLNLFIQTLLIRMQKSENKYYGLLIIMAVMLMANAGTVVAQRTPKTGTPGRPPAVKPDKLYAVANPSKNKIMLRWAPADNATWRENNKYGYAIEKYTVQRDGKLLPKFELSQPRIIINMKPMTAWDSMANKNDYAAVMAQAMFGDDFDLTLNGGEKVGVARILSETEKARQRFALAMYATDHSYDAAVFGGLGYTDTHVKQGEKYFYRIFALTPKNLHKSDTATAFTGLAEFKPLPVPPQIVPQFGDHAVVLQWDFESYKEYYTTYIIEKSADSGKNYNIVSDKPFTSLTDNQPGQAAPGIFYTDSLASNDITYTYRVAGISLFGDTSRYSKPVSGKGKTFLPVTPGITSATQDASGRYMLNWQMEDSLNYLIKEFRISQSEISEGPYKMVQQGISPQKRTAYIDSLYASNYFKVIAVSKDGEEKSSFTYLLQPEDSTAPATPAAFTAGIDTLGVVTLKWEPNQEKDLAGYRIFKAIAKGHEMQPVFDSLYKGTLFTDTLKAKDLTSKAFYMIKAVDKRYNQSVPTNIAEVTKKDVSPPSKPIFSTYNITEEGAKIEWINSPEADVVVHNLYRKKTAGNDKWQLVKSYPGITLTAITEKDLEEDVSYSYTLIAIDSAKLESEPALPLTITLPNKRVKVAVKKLQLETDRDNRKITIEWKKIPEVKNIKQFELYRGTEKIKMSLYKILDKTAETFTDSNLQINTVYQYGIRAVFSTGMYSDFVIEKIIY